MQYYLWDNLRDRNFNSKDEFLRIYLSQYELLAMCKPDIALSLYIYIIRCKNASGREKGEKMKKNAFFLKILSEKFGGTEKMYYLCTRI